jgi:hypothetical protein
MEAMKEDPYVSGSYYCGRCMNRSPEYRKWASVYDWILRHKCELIERELICPN